MSSDFIAQETYTSKLGTAVLCYESSLALGLRVFKYQVPVLVLLPIDSNQQFTQHDKAMSVLPT